MEGRESSAAGPAGRIAAKAPMPVRVGVALAAALIVLRMLRRRRRG